MLAATELDKFKGIKQNPDLRVMTTFYCDEALDNSFYWIHW